MNKTNIERTEEKILVDIIDLQNMLSLGKNMSNEVGEKAGAVTRIGRRKLYSVDKIKAYLNSITE